MKLLNAKFGLLACLLVVGAVSAQDTDGKSEDGSDAAAGDGAQQKVEVEVTKAPAPGPESAGGDADIFWQILSRGHECSTEDIEIGEADTVERCAMRCAVFEGCQYFIFGHGDKAHMCWFEKTTDGCVKDGHLVENDYSLYEIRDSDVNKEEFRTIDGEYSYYRIIVSAAREQQANSSFCIEDIVFYDANNTPVTTTGGECNIGDTAATYASPTKPSRSCCMSTPTVPGHSCAEAFDPAKADSWFCSITSIGFIGYQFDQPTYVHSYAVHDVYGLHALDPESWTLQASVDGVSWIVLDTARNIPWVTDQGVYMNRVGGVSYNLLYREAECSSPDIMLGVVANAEKCAELCAKLDDCEYFIFGKNSKAGRCYFEITTDGCKGDGYPQRDDFDLYYVIRTGSEGDGGASIGNIKVSTNLHQAYCGSFFGNCSNVFLLLFLLLVLGGGLFLVRSIMKKRYARLNRVEYDDDGDHDESEA